MDENELIKFAIDAKQHSYSPYSNFRVGAAVLTDTLKVYTGVNIENVSFGATCCAERTAVFKAVSEGERKIIAIAITSDSKDYVYPCGICRQVLAQFGTEDMKVICTKNDGSYRIFMLKDLLPEAFIKF